MRTKQINKQIKDDIRGGIFALALLLPGRKGQSTVTPMQKILALIIALLLLGFIAWIMLGVTRQGEKAALNLTRIWRFT